MEFDANTCTFSATCVKYRKYRRRWFKYAPNYTNNQRGLKYIHAQFDYILNSRRKTEIDPSYSLCVTHRSRESRAPLSKSMVPANALVKICPRKYITKGQEEEFRYK